MLNLNKEKRRRLREAQRLLASATRIVEQVRDEEQDDFDNMPESLQESDNGQRMEEAIDHLDDALRALEEADECIDSAEG